MQEPRIFQIPWSNKQAAKRIVIFHHAGGSSLSFLRVGRVLAKECEVWLAEMPGHGTRQKELFAESISSFAADCAKELVSADDRPILLYGHSLGALVAYEVALALGRSAALGALVISSCNAPLEPHGPKNFPIYSLQDLENEETLLAIQREYGSFGPELGSPQLKAFFLPVLRSDLKLIASYRAGVGRVACELSALGGESDPVINSHELDRWRAHTEQGFALRVFPGGHFFPFQNAEAFQRLVDFLREKLQAISHH